VRIHKTLRTTPAMAARVTERLWEIGDIVNVLGHGRLPSEAPLSGRKAMEWFSQKTSIAGIQIFQLDTRCGGYSRNLDYLLVYLALR
jgi:hypothetical protein